ncbi:MAG: hypothetical protein EAZ55_12515 [Cytophagales bacterium]|nr:MAG: hypothetical protein EAZ55_12515 [Cytophagales bacterium]
MRTEDETLENNWQALLDVLAILVGKRPKDLNAVLFLVGVQELGKGIQTFDKEEKQNLMHIALCRILSKAGYYELTGIDQDGWPHWKPTQQLPHLNLDEQEYLLKKYILDYFADEQIIT